MQLSKIHLVFLNYKTWYLNVLLFSDHFLQGQLIFSCSSKYLSDYFLLRCLSLYEIMCFVIPVAMSSAVLFCPKYSANSPVGSTRYWMMVWSTWETERNYSNIDWKLILWSGGNDTEHYKDPLGDALWKTFIKLVLFNLVKHSRAAFSLSF